MDNSSLNEKVKIRAEVLKRMNETPVILEAFGGSGAIFDRCYRFTKNGVVIDNDPTKAEKLAIRRPTWAVYEGDSAECIQAGAGAHLPINFLDADPYGSALDVIAAFFESDRPRVHQLFIVAHDGLCIRLGRFGGWDIARIKPYVHKFGDAELFKNYTMICKLFITDVAEPVGYALENFGGFTSKKGHTHFWMELKYNEI